MPGDSAGQLFPSTVIRHCFQRVSVLQGWKPHHPSSWALTALDFLLPAVVEPGQNKILISDGAIQQGLCNNDAGVQTGLECRFRVCWQLPVHRKVGPASAFAHLNFCVCSAVSLHHS